MAKGKLRGWSVCTGVAREILRERAQRRLVMGKMLLLALALMAAGLWLIEPWLAADPWRFFLWWAGCALLTCLTMLFALYDCVAVLREERARVRSTRQDH
jgi:peptidoglycan biosynthesis protein MviN/MurJ (putative lipid II flippase)